MNEEVDKDRLTVLKANPVLITEEEMDRDLILIKYSYYGKRSASKRAKDVLINAQMVSVVLVETPYRDTWIRVVAILSPKDFSNQDEKTKYQLERLEKVKAIVLNYEKQVSPKKNLYVNLFPIRSQKVLDYLKAGGINLPFSYKASILRAEELTNHEKHLVFMRRKAIERETQH